MAYKVKVDPNKGISLTSREEIFEYLQHFGYKNPVYMGKNEYEVATIGAELPAITILQHEVGNDEISKMGESILKLRQERGLTAEEFAPTILLTPEELQKLETGEEKVDAVTFTLIKNLYNVDPQLFRKGIVQEVEYRKNMMEIMEEIKQDLSVIKEDSNYMKSVIKKYNLDELQYLVKQNSELSFVIYDSASEEYIVDENGRVQSWDVEAAAKKVANELNRKNTPEPIQAAEISNIEYNDIVRVTDKKDVEPRI